MTWAPLERRLDAFARHVAEGKALYTYLRLPFSELRRLKAGEAHVNAL